MQEEHRIALLLGQSLARLAPQLEEVARRLDKTGTRALRNKVAREFHYARCIHRGLLQAQDPSWPHNAETTLAMELAGDAGAERTARVVPVPTERQRHQTAVLRLVVDNTGVAHDAA